MIVRWGVNSERGAFRGNLPSLSSGFGPAIPTRREELAIMSEVYEQVLDRMLRAIRVASATQKSTDKDHIERRRVKDRCLQSPRTISHYTFLPNKSHLYTGPPTSHSSNLITSNKEKFHCRTSLSSAMVCLLAESFSSTTNED